MKIRKKPLVVDGYYWNGTLKEANKIIKTIGSNIIHLKSSNDGLFIVVETLEGNMIAKKGDWIIKGVDDEIYPVKPEIFTKTYEIIK